MMLRIFLSALLSLSAATAVAQNEPVELEEVERRLKDQAEEEKRLRDEAEAREREVAALRHRLIETANSLQEAERKITALEESIEALEVEQSEAEEALRAESENLSEVLAALQSLEMSRPPALLVTPENANEAARAAMLLSDAAPQVEARAQRLRQAIDRLAALTRTLEEDRTRLSESNRELEGRRDVLAELMKQKEEERSVAEKLASTAQRETAQLAARATSLREVLQRLERLAHSVTPRIKPPPPLRRIGSTGNVPPPAIKPETRTPLVTARRFNDARGALRAPVAGRLTGEFGKNRPEGGVYKGMRFTVRDQAIVTAPFEGRVEFAQYWQPVGNLIVLDVGGGFHVLLIGVGSILVEESQRVAAGEPIAEMAGRGAILDLEIRKDREPVNPALWLSRKSIEELAD